MNVISCQSVRHLIYCVFITALCSSVEAQSKKIYRVGFLSLTTPFSSARKEEVRQALRKLRYIEGQNLVIKHSDAERLDQLPQLASDLVKDEVDVIVAWGPAAFAAKSVSPVTPIVFIGVQDPVASQLVRSLAAPGGNATGITNLGSELGEKRLEILKEVSPKSTRIAFLFTSSTPEARLELSTQKSAQAFAVQLQSYEVRDSQAVRYCFRSNIKEQCSRPAD